MGIPLFVVWVRKNYPECIKSFSGKPVFRKPIDNLYIDANGIFHPVCRDYFFPDTGMKSLRHPPKKPITTDEGSYSKICEKIDDIYKKTNPTNTIMVCVDGVANRAKMCQQRQRRFKSGREKTQEMMNTFDSNCITPGITWMSNLMNYLRAWLKTKKKTNWRPLKILFSPSSTPGEGEHKAVEHIRDTVRNESCCIVGLDADLIMLALAANTPNIFILREEDDQDTVVDIDRLREYLIDDFGWPGCDPYILILDFVFIAFIVGNDFLPKIPSIEILKGGVEVLRDMYKSTNGHMIRRVNDGHEGSETCVKYVFNDKSLQYFLQRIGSYEYELMNKKFNSRDCYHPDLLMKECSVSTKSGWILNFAKYKTEYNKRKMLLAQSEQREQGRGTRDLEKCCHSYLQGMEWVIRYYTTGVPSWDWFYPYLYSPFASDLATYISTYKHFEFHCGTSDDPEFQLMCVMPPQSRKLIPERLHTILNDTDFPLDFEVDLAGKKHEWEAIALIPIINFDKYLELFTECNEGRTK